MKRISLKSIQDIMNNLEEMIECKNEQLDNENNKDYPNDERIDKLESQIECLENALESLQDYEA